MRKLKGAVMTIPMARWCLVLLAASLMPSPAYPAEATTVTVPPFERMRLPNGATLLLMERRDVPLVTFTALLRGGASADPPTRIGTASLLASLLEKGAGKRNAYQFAEAVAAVGGSIQSGVDVESIELSGSFLAQDQALMVELLADMLQRPSLQQSELETLRARHIEFLRAAKDSELDSLLPIYGAANLFPGHPYGRAVDGSEASLAAVTHAAVREYYDQHLGADRLILAVVGDFRTAQMKQLLTRAFSSWRKATAPLPAILALPPVQQRRVVLIDAPDSVQSYFWAGNVAIAKADPRRAALDVANTLFGGRFTSMLNTELRVRTGLSYGARSGFRKLAQGGSWQISSFTRTETTAQAIDLALATLDKLHQENAFDAPLLDSAKKYVLGQFPLGLETAGQWAGQLAMLELYGLDRSYIEGYGPALAAVTAPLSSKAIAEVIPKSQALLLVVIGKAEAIRKDLVKYGPVTEMKLADPVFAPGGG